MAQGVLQTEAEPKICGNLTVLPTLGLLLAVQIYGFAHALFVALQIL